MGIMSGRRGILPDTRKQLNPYIDNFLWRDTNGIVRHFEVMDSCHLVKTRKLLDRMLPSRSRKERIANINKIIESRGYTKEMYRKDFDEVRKGLQENPYKDEIQANIEGFLLGFGSKDVWLHEEPWWIKLGYVKNEDAEKKEDET